MKHLRLFILFIFLGSFTVLSQEALPNNPEENPDANACFEGGKMEGKCNQDIDGDGIVEDYEVQWAWQCGWYIIRYDYQIYSREEIPSACDSLLPSLPASVGEDEDNCYILRNVGYELSIVYIGPSNSPYNFLKFPNLNCKGTPMAFVDTWVESIIFANNRSQALIICNGLAAGLPFLDSEPLSYLDPSAPENAWYCADLTS